MPTWHDNSNPKNQVDSTLALTKLLLSNDEQVLAVLSEYLPKFRSWLAQAEIEKIQYWSAFDALQQVTLTDRKPLRLDDFTWPAGAQFIRMYDRIVVLADLTHYATVYFTYPAADMIDRIDLLQHGKPYKQLTIDDRGFVSRVLTYDDNQLIEIAYLSQSGFVVAQQDYRTGLVEAQLPDGSTQNLSSMNELIRGLVVEDLLAAKEVETVLVEPNADNLAIAEQIQRHQPVLVLDYPNFGADLNQEVSRKEIEEFDTVSGQNRLDDQHLASKNLVLGPYEVDLSQKKSQPKGQFVCYWRLGLMSADYANHIFTALFEIAMKNPQFTLVVENDMWQVGFQQLLADKLDLIKQVGDLSEERQEVLASQFVLIDWQNSQQQHAYLDTAAVVLDLADQVDLSLHAQALAHAVPMLTKVKTAYQLGDAQQIQSTKDLVDRLEWLLNQENWQMSQQKLLDLQLDFTKDKLSQRWLAALQNI